MDRRLELQALLTALAGRAYFVQPPDGQLVYPCIIYQLSDIDKEYAGNETYKMSAQYQVTIIDRDADSVIVKAVAALPMCRFGSYFVTDNLHHTVFNLYF